MAKRHLPVLETDNLLLRDVTHADAPAIFAYASDPAVTRFTHWAQHTTIHDTHAFITNICAHTMIWGIEHKDSKTIIGECGFVNFTHPTAELYYALAPEYWGNGLATQAVTALMEFSFKKLQLNRLEAWIIKDNRASARVAQKAGMECSTIFPQQWYAHQMLHDICVYSKQAP